MKKILYLPVLVIILFSISACNNIQNLSVGDILKYGKELNGKTVKVSGYVTQLNIPKYNEKYGYVTYYLKLSDEEEIQVNYSGPDAETINYNAYDILEAEGVVTDVYAVRNTILQIDCKKLDKTGQATPAQKKAKKEESQGNSGSVAGLMQLSMNATDRDKKIDYAKKACEMAGVEPKVLTDKEFSDLLNRIDEIDTSVQSLEGKKDRDSLEKSVKLQEEKMDLVVLKFYNQTIKISK
ncbi:MAG: hypothetical protein IJJ55_01355 [Clostridia bacterium]|nr:hypothetical protein [Clostridia bacterium]